MLYELQAVAGITKILKIFYINKISYVDKKWIFGVKWGDGGNRKSKKA